MSKNQHRAEPARRAPAYWTLFFSALCASAPARADVAQVWYQNNVFWRLNEQWSIGNYLDLRVTDAVGELATTMFSPRVRYDLHPNWSAQVNTSWVEAQAANAQGRTEFLRLEFELNPHYVLTERLTFSARNRFELRWIEDVDDVNERIRVRPQFDLRTPWAGPVHGVYFNNETFYDFEQGKITENRLTPFGLVFKPTAALELRAYHLWRRTRQGHQWFNFQVLGVLANVSF